MTTNGFWMPDWENMQEFGYYDRKRIHNLKYFTWIEQQGREVSELNAQWQDHQNYWKESSALNPRSIL
ncbi:MAG: hypothetical protein Ct9H90mP9_0170 [Pseudomonadota bacterium]|nr:MAG: hypothetical protein Ct9H90mP9_0170 [Pseudomonadota bacterium]